MVALACSVSPHPRNQICLYTNPLLLPMENERATRGEESAPCYTCRPYYGKHRLLEHPLENVSRVPCSSRVVGGKDIKFNITRTHTPCGWLLLLCVPVQPWPRVSLLCWHRAFFYNVTSCRQLLRSSHPPEEPLRKTTHSLTGAPCWKIPSSAA